MQKNKHEISILFGKKFSDVIYKFKDKREFRARRWFLAIQVVRGLYPRTKISVTNKYDCILGHRTSQTLMLPIHQLPGSLWRPPIPLASFRFVVLLVDERRICHDIR